MSLHYLGLILTRGELQTFPAASLVNPAEDTKRREVHPLTKNARPGKINKEEMIGKGQRKPGRKKKGTED